MLIAAAGLIGLLLSSSAVAEPLPEVSVRDGRLFAGEAALEVRGIAYGGWLPAPLVAHQSSVVDADLRRMRRLGFNCIKQWGPVSDDLLDRCEGAGIYVLESVNANSAYPFADHEAFVESRLAQIRDVMLPRDARSVILGWNLGSELHDGDWQARDPRIAQYLAAALECFHSQSARPVTYGNLMSAVDNLDLAGLDFYGLQVYMHSRPQFRRLLQHVRETQRPGQPLLITEFGTASCPQPSGWGRQPLDQGLGYAMQWEEIMRCGASGGVFFEWGDEWYKGPPGNDPDVQDGHSEEHFGLLEAGRRLKPAVAHMARRWGAIRTVAQPEGLVLPREATLWLAPEADPVAIALDDSSFHETLAQYLPQAFEEWTVCRTPDLPARVAAIVPAGRGLDLATVATLLSAGQALGPGEGAILGGAPDQPTLLAGGDGYGLLAAFDSYLEAWRSDPAFACTRVTVLGGVLEDLPPQRYCVDLGPDAQTEAMVINQLFLWGADTGYITDEVRRGAGLFITGGWGTFGGHGETRPGWQGTSLEQALPVTLQPGADSRDLTPPQRPVIVAPGHPLARALEGFPPIYGCNRETALPGAEVILALEDGTPVLVAGQYGKGRVLCLMTSLGPGWGVEVATWPGREAFVQACVDWVAGR